MGKYKEDAQDDILRQMDKLTRRAPKDDRDFSLKAQLEKLKNYDKLTIEQKRAAADPRVWKDALQKYMVHEKCICTPKTYENICGRFGSTIDEFKAAGSSFYDMIPFFEEKNSFFTNRF
jgi:hypothetical protein